MRLIIKNKLISLRGSSFVKDENGNDAFIIKGRSEERRVGKEC